MGLVGRAWRDSLRLLPAVVVSARVLRRNYKREKPHASRRVGPGEVDPGHDGCRDALDGNWLCVHHAPHCGGRSGGNRSGGTPTAVRGCRACQAGAASCASCLWSWQRKFAGKAGNPLDEYRDPHRRRFLPRAPGAALVRFRFAGDVPATIRSQPALFHGPRFHWCACGNGWIFSLLPQSWRGLLRAYPGRRVQLLFSSPCRHGRGSRRSRGGSLSRS